MSNFFDRFDKPEESESTTRGRQMNSSLQGFFNAMQGPTLGFGDEIAGVGGALAGGVANLVGFGDGKSWGENYRNTRDAVRGAVGQFEEDRPALAMGTKLAAAAPLMAFNPGAGAVSRALPVGMARQAGEALISGGVFGTAQGAGESTADTLGGVVQDALESGAKSATLGAGSVPLMRAGGAVLGAVAQRVSNSSAAKWARLKIAEALARDSADNPIAIEEAANVLGGFGREGRVVDAAGVQTGKLLDTVATMPGKTANTLQRAQMERAATRGPRLVNAADDALGTQGAELRGTVKTLVEGREKLAAPLYRKLDGVDVAVDGELAHLFKRAGAYDKIVREITQAETGAAMDLSKFQLGDLVPFRAMDTLKRGLDAAAKLSHKEGAPTELTRSIDRLRKDLLKKLDAVSPRGVGGVPVYRQAREAFAGESAIIDAAEQGARAMRDDVFKVGDALAGMTKTERDAFKIGALQALKDQAGTQGGQTTLLSFWKNPKTADRLRAIFENKFDDFAKALDAEAKMKLLEGIGKGSQTASRLFQGEDLAKSPLMDVVKGMAAKSPTSILGGFGRAWQQARVPEATRDEIGRLLLEQGDEGVRAINSLREALDRVNEARLRAASGAGTFWGVQ